MTEEVAYYNGITPTQVGEYLLESFAAFERALEVMTQNIVYSAENILRWHWHFLERVGEAGRHALRICRQESRQLETIEKALPALAARRIRWERQQLTQWEKWLKAVSPEKILQRGFAYVYSGGRIVKEAADLRAGDAIHIRFRRGEAEAEVTKTRTVTKTR